MGSNAIQLAFLGYEGRRKFSVLSMDCLGRTKKYIFRKGLRGPLRGKHLP